MGRRGRDHFPGSRFCSGAAASGTAAATFSAADAPRAAVERVGEAAAYAARASVRRTAPGYRHPTLARHGRRDGVLPLSAHLRATFTDDTIGICTVRRQRDRLDQLHCATGAPRAADIKTTSTEKIGHRSAKLAAPSQTKKGPAGLATRGALKLGRGGADGTAPDPYIGPPPANACEADHRSEKILERRRRLSGAASRYRRRYRPPRCG